MDPFSAMIVDDHPFLRMAVRKLLEQKGYNVIAEADNGIDAIKILRNQPCDIMVLDLDIPQLSGLEVMKRVTASHPATKILVLTAQTPALYAVRCAEAGAAGILGKHEELENLAEAVKMILRGYRFFPQTDARGNLAAEVMSETELLNSLTNRELQVLRALCQGQANIDIADAMAISYKTVSTHKANIMDKLGLNSLLELIEFARRNQLL
ncbi:response regulator [Rheinheimera sp. NSM]|uniref:response regulator n=1 Tax=Rheinheimera sp. NSM TaxID=3457884 RepID=UPI004034F9FA